MSQLLAAPHRPLLAALCLIPCLASAQAPLRVMVDGAVKSVSVDQLKAAGAETVSVTPHHGAPTTYRGVPLLKVLALGGMNADSVRGYDLTRVVVAIAADNYKVVYALAELTIGGRSAILAFEENGHPLGAETGPYRMIVQQDTKQSRWIHQLTELRVVNVVP